MITRPILFSAPMVRALLAGTKTHTRRVVKPLRRWSSQYPVLDALACAASHAAWWWDGLHKHVGVMQRCPYGQPGDRLWVRETWCREFEGGFNYRADDAPGEKAEFVDANGEPLKGTRWKPSIHMPRWASRITLEITGVRVERLQDISREDAIAEGLYQDVAGRWTTYSATEQAREHLSPIEAYRDLWVQINGPGSWDANPWVWVVKFRRVSA